ncbi:MAG: (2Fe-2S)-binding protein [Arcobacteraceae bacterium]|nr:(2Fe-2S)-binding protein [Arcobacteraceae bacterium]
MMANFHYTHKVCECKNVTLGEIIHAIKEKNASIIEDIKNITDAGTACGCCISKNKDFGDPKMELYIEDILKKFA